MFYSWIEADCRILQINGFCHVQLLDLQQLLLFGTHMLPFLLISLVAFTSSELRVFLCSTLLLRWFVVVFCSASSLIFFHVLLPLLPTPFPCFWNCLWVYTCLNLDNPFRIDYFFPFHHQPANRTASTSLVFPEKIDIFLLMVTLPHHLSFHNKTIEHFWSLCWLFDLIIADFFSCWRFIVFSFTRIFNMLWLLSDYDKYEDN